jgi:hypothetical protein
MGWFAVSAVLGFLLFWLWHFLAPVLQPLETDGQRSAALNPAGWAIGAVIAALILGLLVWVLFIERSDSLGDALAAVGHGQVARFLLGMPLGFGLGYFLSQGVTRKEFLWLTAPVVGLALISPSVDTLLGDLTHFKSSFFELQLANNKTSNLTYKVRVAEEKETFTGANALSALGDYHRRIEQDIMYVRDVELPQLKRKGMKDSGLKQVIEKREKYVASATRIYPAFRDLIGPIARCFEAAIDAGLSVQRVRDKMVPATQLLLQIVFGRDDNTKHEAFWAEVLSAPEKIDALRVDMGHAQSDGSCAGHAKKYLDSNKSLTDENAYPRIAQHAHLPYLHVAAAALLAFGNDTDLALRVLEKGEPKIELEDYRLLLFTFEFRYYKGEPAATGLAPLEKLLQIAIGHQRAIEAHCRLGACSEEIEELRKRARLAEIIGMNSIAYRVAVDLARGIDTNSG